MTFSLPMSAIPSEFPSIRVWDIFVRLFHWSLVACVIFNLFIRDDGETLHQWSGYGAAALVLMRIVWGFVGSTHARFSDFFPTPARLREHLAQLRRREVPQHLGHNPLGALMMLALMALVIALGITGWMQGTDAFWGEEWLQELHELLARALQLLVALHVLAAIVMSRLEKVDLVRAMITGFKRVRER